MSSPSREILPIVFTSTRPMSFPASNEKRNAEVIRSLDTSNRPGVSPVILRTREFGPHRPTRPPPCLVEESPSPAANDATINSAMDAS